MTHKRIEWDAHSILRMAERGIRRQDVRWLLAEGLPAEVEQHRHSDPVFGRRGTLEGGREAKVVYLENAERIYVITVMWTDERGK